MAIFGRRLGAFIWLHLLSEIGVLCGFNNKRNKKDERLKVEKCELTRNHAAKQTTRLINWLVSGARVDCIP